MAVWSHARAPQGDAILKSTYCIHPLSSPGSACSRSSVIATPPRQSPPIRYRLTTYRREGSDRVRADQAASHFGFQELRRSGRSGHRTGADRRCRAQWLRQVESARSAALDDGREQRAVDARRGHGRRHLRRHRDAPATRLCRGHDPGRARGRGDRDRPPDRTRRGLGLSDRRTRRARQGRGAAVRRCRDRRPLARFGQPEPDRRSPHPAAPDWLRSRASQACGDRRGRRSATGCCRSRSGWRRGG